METEMIGMKPKDAIKLDEVDEGGTSGGWIISIPITTQ